MGRQVEAHHFCSHPSEEMRQCILFDSDQKGKLEGCAWGCMCVYMSGARLGGWLRSAHAHAPAWAQAQRRSSSTLRCPAGARLTGVEYIISERLFAELPPEEKRYWHSHRCARTGLLLPPGHALCAPCCSSHSAWASAHSSQSAPRIHTPPAPSVPVMRWGLGCWWRPACPTSLSARTCRG